MGIPNYQADVEALRAERPDLWHEAHRKGPRTNAFARLLAWRLHQKDPNVGLNGKRGNPNDLSDDCLCYRGPAAATAKSVDVRTGQRVAVIDFIAGAPNTPSDRDGTPAWNEVWDPNTIPTHATWVQPAPVTGEIPTPSPTPTPAPPPPAPSGVSREEVQALIQAALAPVLAALAERPTYDSTIALQAHEGKGKLLCAEGGGPAHDYEPFQLTSRSAVGPWESWRIRRT